MADEAGQGIRARVGELDPEARRADEDADPTRPGGVFDACARGGHGAGEGYFERWERVREVVVVRRGERAHGEHGGARCVNEMNESSRARRRDGETTRRDEEEERGERRAWECSRVKKSKKKEKK